MSHFTVLVVGQDHEAQLAPFVEQASEGSEEYNKYFVFEDRTEDLQKEYAEESAEIKAKYPTFKEYAEDYHGHGEPNAEGRYGYMTNPNAKWDWYSVGGRWRGFFKVKKGVAAKVSEPHWTETLNGETPKDCGGRADECLKGDIDIEGMRDEAEQKGAERFDRFAAIVTRYQELTDFIPNFGEWVAEGERDKANVKALVGRRFDMDADSNVAVQGPLPYRFTREEIDAVFKRLRDNGGHNAVDAYRESYGKIPVIKALHSDRDLVWVNDYRKEFNGGDRAAYLADCRAGAISTFAVLKDGKWYERGSMGWFGCVSDEKDSAAWETEFSRLLDNLPDDTPLTLVDCHI